MKKSKIFLTCGLTGSGKTYYSKGIENQRNAIRFSLDEWMIKLYGQHPPKELFEIYLKRCTDLIYEQVEK